MDSISSSLNAQISMSQLASKPLSQSNKKENPAGSMLQSFGDVLKQQLNQINDAQLAAEDATQTYALGGEIELHNVIMATEKAELSLQFATQVRNKLLSAYQDIYKMPI